jgi:hypothetical protein
VRDRLDAVMSRQRVGMPEPDERLTVGEFLQRWIDDDVPGTVSDGTLDTSERASAYPKHGSRSPLIPRADAPLDAPHMFRTDDVGRRTSDRQRGTRRQRQSSRGPSDHAAHTSFLTVGALESSSIASLTRAVVDRMSMASVRCRSGWPSAARMLGRQADHAVARSLVCR